MRRRQFLQLACAVLTSSSSAFAQDAAANYPSKPVRLLIGYQAGGPTDMAARLLAGKLQESMGQPFIVENRPGAGSNLATDLVARASPDGYTVLVAAAPIVSNGFIYKNLKWKVDQSFEPIAMFMSAPGVLAVAPNVPIRTLQELIDYAKANPGKLSVASTGVGGTQHLAAEMLQKRAGIQLIHVPYKGSAGMLTDLVGGQVSMGFLTSVGAMPYFKEGSVRPIAVAAASRLPQLLDVPTLSEAGLPGFESDSWNGLLAPKGTPPDIVAKLNAEINKAIASPEVKGALERQGGVIVGGTPNDFRDRIRKDLNHWDAFLKTVPITVN